MLPIKVPPPRERRIIDALLHNYFAEQNSADLKKALQLLDDFYRIGKPRIVFVESFADRTTGGDCDPDGKIRLIQPDSWRASPKYNTAKRWVAIFYHEYAHFLLWAKAEGKAEAFERRFVRGIRGT